MAYIREADIARSVSLAGPERLLEFEARLWE